MQNPQHTDQKVFSLLQEVLPQSNTTKEEILFDVECPGVGTDQIYKYDKKEGLRYIWSVTTPKGTFVTLQVRVSGESEPDRAKKTFLDMVNSYLQKVQEAGMKIELIDTRETTNEENKFQEGAQVYLMPSDQ